ncbi:MAG TPA: hypothetical protein VGM90_24705 [Kofleriaceae bacterium]|jgi:crotonobetainyl-CoA:carnitine CoA-transferase CaiB-like acyl-CoA transferase
MADGIPVRLTAKLVELARKEAELQERSVTDQVEHWARLGQVVEAAISSASARRIKQVSHDPRLAERLMFADTEAGRQKALALIKSRNPVRYGVDTKGTISRAAKPTKGKR